MNPKFVILGEYGKGKPLSAEIGRLATGGSCQRIAAAYS
jgi:hypothetical protein